MTTSHARFDTVYKTSRTFEGRSPTLGDKSCDRGCMPRASSVLEPRYIRRSSLEKALLWLNRGAQKIREGAPICATVYFFDLGS